MDQGCAYIDGEFLSIEDAKISVLDQGFTHGDAVYDVTSVWKGSFFRLTEHVNRFLNSCQGWGLTCPVGAAELGRVLAQCVIKAGLLEAAYVAVVATRGGYADEEARQARDISRTRTTFIAYAVPYQWIATPAQQQRGIHLIIAKTPRIPEACVNLKYKNYHWGDLIQGKFEARAAGADEAVHLSIDGKLTEGAGFNVFFVKNGCLYTPARNVLEGITRAAAIELARERQMPVKIGDFTAAEFRSCDEAFITSTAGGIMPVRAIEKRHFPGDEPGPISVELRKLYWSRREQGWGGTPVEMAEKR